MLKPICMTLILCSALGVANAETRTIEFKDKVNGYVEKVVYDCDFAVPRAYSCRKQEVVLHDGTRYVSSSIPKESDGTYKFWISELGYVATRNQDIYTLLAYLDTSGSPSRAEERFELVEFTNGLGRSKFGLMTSKQYQATLKKIGSQFQTRYVGGLD